MKKSFVKLVALVAVMSALSSCVKKDFDSPPSTNVDPNVTANKTIAQIKTLADPGGAILQITDNIIISGVVNSDDRSGNIYKTIIFQDETAGILINVDLSNFYALFPTGRKIFVKSQGLYIAKVNGTVQLGILDNSGTQPALGRLPQSLVDTYILRGVWGLTVTPKVVSLSSLANYNVAYENMLVTMNNVEFTPADTAKPYANAALQASLSRYLQDCTGTSTLEVYSSGYATFASTLTPKGGGSITGIYQAYGSYPQFVIRDLTDVNMNGPRLSATGSFGTGGLMTLAAVRALYPTCGGTFAAGTKIRGTVISDKTTANITANNLILQDGTGGIIVRFTSANTFSLNDSIEVTISGDSLTTFAGELQINNIAISNAVNLGVGTITPRTTTIADLNTNSYAWAYTLVKVSNASLTGGTGGTYKGSVIMNDGTGTYTLFTKTAATFSGTTYPTTPVSVTGYIVLFNGNTPELNIRNTTDVQ